MWPYTLFTRGFGPSTGGRAEPAAVEPSGWLTDAGVVPRRLLFVSVATTARWSGNVSIHSGRSIIVAPTASAAARVLMRMSAIDQPPRAGFFGVSGSHSPVPSAWNLAT